MKRTILNAKKYLNLANFLSSFVKRQFRKNISRRLTKINPHIIICTNLIVKFNVKPVKYLIPYAYRTTLHETNPSDISLLAHATLEFLGSGSCIVRKY